MLLVCSHSCFAALLTIHAHTLTFSPLLSSTIGLPFRYGYTCLVRRAAIDVEALLISILILISPPLLQKGTYLSGKVRAIGTGQKDECRSHLNRLSRTTNRSTGAESLERVFGHGSHDERGPDRSGADDTIREYSSHIVRVTGG